MHRGSLGTQKQLPNWCLEEWILGGHWCSPICLCLSQLPRFALHICCVLLPNSCQSLFPHYFCACVAPPQSPHFYISCPVSSSTHHGQETGLWVLARLLGSESWGLTCPADLAELTASGSPGVGPLKDWGFSPPPLACPLPTHQAAGAGQSL